MEEYFDVVNEEDIVIGRESRSTVHRLGLWHRGVHVLLFTDDGKMLVQQRSKNKSQSPLTFDCSVSEHVQEGEEYYNAALRGLSEELGVEGIEIHPLVKFKMNYGPNDNKISMIYKGKVSPNHIRFDPNEIERVEYFNITELEGLTINQPALFSYWFHKILLWHFGAPSALHILDENSKLLYRTLKP